MLVCNITVKVKSQQSVIFMNLRSAQSLPLQDLHSREGMGGPESIDSHVHENALLFWKQYVMVDLIDFRAFSFYPIGQDL